MYLRAQCCVNVANKADVMLSTRLNSHNVLTQTIDVGGMGGEESPESGDKNL